MNQTYRLLVTRAIKTASVLGVLLLVAKVSAYWYTGSVSMLASSIDSLVDIAGSLTNLLVIRYALQPADNEHSFGHGKAESLAALAQSMFISGSALFLILNGVQHLLRPEPLNAPLYGIIVTLIALISTALLVLFQRWVIRKTGSQAVYADMLHYQSDVLVNAAILCALLLTWYGFRQADGVFALATGGYILYSALRLGYLAIQALLDEALPQDEREEIKTIIDNWPDVLGAHDLRTRRSGPTRFIQFHLEMEDQLTLVKVYQLVQCIESALLQRFPGADITIHCDPTSTVPHQRRGFFN